ncbi:MAG: Lrp/AsnC family transcriptional regulator [Bacteroidota bacterium]
MEYTLDDTDLKIINLLQENCRLTNKEIGEIVHKTPSPVFERIKRLEEKGVIKKYVAVLEPSSIGRGHLVFTQVQLADHSNDGLSCFQSQAASFPEVLECFHTSGQFDFLLQIAVKDMKAYHEFLMDRLSRLPFVKAVHSTFVLNASPSKKIIPIKTKANECI